MKSLYFFYFSGTGNTLYVVKKLCELLKSQYDCKLFDVCGSVPNNTVKLADSVAFAYPVYGGAPPIPMRNFFAEHKSELFGKEVIIVETQYMFSGDGAATIGRSANKCGAIVKYAEHFNMPNNLSDCKVFPVKNGEELKPILDKVNARIKKFADRILSGKPFLRGFGFLSHAVGFLSQRALFIKHENSKRGSVKINSDCVGCSACVKNCPVGNLSITEGRVTQQNKCVLCYRCVNLCPEKAIRILGKNPPDIQYKGIRQN